MFEIGVVEILKQYLANAKSIEIEDKVSTKLEISDYLRKYPVPVLFKNIVDYPNWRILGNLCSNRQVFADIFGVSKEELLGTLVYKIGKPSKYKKVQKADFLSNEIDNPELLTNIPLVMYYPDKQRYYTSATIILSIDPDSGRQNASYHRMMYIGKNRFSVRIVARDLFDFYKKNQNRNKDTPVVIICGVHPAISLAAATSFPNIDELELANTYLNGGLKCLDINGISVPSESEVVMVGRLLHNEKNDEGPFVDITGTWDKVRKQPVLEIDRLYIKDNPIWQVILPGWTEHRLLMGITQEPRIFNIVKNSVPSIKKVILTRGGSGWLHAIVSIRKIHEGEGKNAGLASLAAHPSLKRVTVVDDDIDINNMEEVEWAVATRLRPEIGITVIKGARTSSLDPAYAGEGVGSKWIIDATIPMDRDRSDFKKVEGSWS
jgi:UbiD family decarboxylase